MNRRAGVYILKKTMVVVGEMAAGGKRGKSVKAKGRKLYNKRGKP